MIKIGGYVKCVDASGYAFIEAGGTYEVLDTMEATYGAKIHILNGSGARQWYLANRFEAVTGD